VEEEDVEEEDRSPDREAHFVRACAVEMQTDIAQAPFCEKFTGKIAVDTSGDIVLCEPAQSKCTWTLAILYGNLNEKRQGTPPAASFCASLRNRNAHGHVTRDILC